MTEPFNLTLGCLDGAERAETEANEGERRTLRGNGGNIRTLTAQIEDVTSDAVYVGNRCERLQQWNQLYGMICFAEVGELHVSGSVG